MSLLAGAAHSAPPAGRPNIVILLADDLGWNDIGYHGSSVKTPHIDRFVREGIELDRFYVAPYCVPTRAGLLSGRYPHRFGIPYRANFAAQAALPPDAVTLAEVLAKAGYDHRACIGKWHVGDSEQQHPLSQGFTSFYGMLGGMVHYFDHRTIPFGRNAANRPRLLDWHRGRDRCNQLSDCRVTYAGASPGWSEADVEHFLFLRAGREPLVTCFPETRDNCEAR